MTAQTQQHRNHALLKAYAQMIVDDDRFPLLLETLERELFDRWREEFDPDRREVIHHEYLGFKLFLSKIKALAYKGKAVKPLKLT